MKNIFILLFFVASGSLFAQINFVHQDTYTWMNENAPQVLTQIDQVLNDDGGEVDWRSFRADFRTTTNMLFNVGQNLVMDNNDRQQRSDRYANYEDFVYVSREDPSLIEVNFSTQTALRFQVLTNELKDISKAIAELNYPLSDAKEGFLEAKSMLKKYKQTYNEANEILNGNKVN